MINLIIILTVLACFFIAVTFNKNKSGYLPLEIRCKIQAEKRAKNTAFEKWQVDNFSELWKCYQLFKDKTSFSEFTKSVYHEEIEIIR